jgi:hypothetical protein
MREESRSKNILRAFRPFERDLQLIGHAHPFYTWGARRLDGFLIAAEAEGGLLDQHNSGGLNGWPSISINVLIAALTLLEPAVEGTAPTNTLTAIPDDGIPRLEDPHKSRDRTAHHRLARRPPM